MTDAAMIDILEGHVLLTEMWSADFAARLSTQAFTFDGYCTVVISWIRAMVKKAASETRTDTSGNRTKLHQSSRQLFCRANSIMLGDLEPCLNSNLLPGEFYS